MNDYAAQNMKQADYASAVGSQIASAGNLSAPRSAMTTLGSILEQMQKLTAMSNELAVRIVGQMPEANEASASLSIDPMSNLATATVAIERAAHRAEQNLARALNGL